MQTMLSYCKFFVKLAVILLAFSKSTLEAAPKGYYGDQTSFALRELRDTLDTVRHEVNNHEIEIKTYDEKIHNLETIIDSLRQHSTETAQAHKNALMDSSSTLETKINGLETTSKGLVADIKQFKNHANETASTLAQYKKKLSDLEKIIDIQNQNLDHLQTVLKSLTDAFQVKNNLTSSSSMEKVYKVATGDSLEKIARKHQTTVQAIKDLNGLTNNKIIIGQTLKIP